MAFQVGTQIRPELADADYSGFANAATIQAQALQNLGKQIAGGIDKYQKNKQITAAGLAELEGIVAANPNAYAAVQNAGGEAAKSIKALEEGNYKQRDVLTALGAVQAYEGEQQKQQKVSLAALQQQLMQSELDTQNLNNQAFDMAIGANTTPEGTVDPEGALKTYLDRGGSDPGKLKLIQTMQELGERDKPSQFEVLNIAGFNVLLDNGKRIMVTKADGSEVETPSAIQIIDYKIAQRKKARQFYEQGNENEANDLLAALGDKDFLGRPLKASEAFGSVDSDKGLTEEEQKELDQLRALQEK